MAPIPSRSTPDRSSGPPDGLGQLATRMGGEGAVVQTGEPIGMPDAPHPWRARNGTHVDDLGLLLVSV